MTGMSARGIRYDTDRRQNPPVKTVSGRTVGSYTLLKILLRFYKVMMELEIGSLPYETL